MAAKTEADRQTAPLAVSATLFAATPFAAALFAATVFATTLRPFGAMVSTFLRPSLRVGGKCASDHKRHGHAQNQLSLICPKHLGSPFS
ncbi:MAG: hypothetical protein HQ546_03140 [Planctomycetes bacterium]|nr:hypothetical protein [Planctomycetota bacterium]